MSALYHIARLTLTDFRSYQAARLETDARPVVLTGVNGAGKTNILEAVSFLTPGRGLRGAKLADVQRHQAATPWAVAATLQTPTGPVDIGTGKDPSPTLTLDRRVVVINGMPARSQTALADYGAMAWLTPSMDRLFQEGASERRRFLDRLVFTFDPSHAGRLTRYEKALRERSRILREHPRPDPAWLRALEDEMATSGVAIAAARRDLTQRLDAVARGANSAPFPKVALSVSGLAEDLLEKGRPAVDVEDTLRRALAAARPMANNDDESAPLLATPGPHRSDWQVYHMEKSMPAPLCSTGEQKALLIAIILAHARLMHAERGAAPLLLFDEVAAHLDAFRREALFDILLSFQSQVWLTGTDESDFASLGSRAQFFTITNGQPIRKGS